MTSAQGFTTKDYDTSHDIRSITELVRVINEITDADELATYYTHDAVHISPFVPGLYHGQAEIREDFAQRLEGVTQRTLDDIDLNVVTNGNMAVAYSQQKISTTKGGETKQTTLRSQDVFQKEGDGWKIVLQHTSYFVDMSKQMAVMDYEFIKPGLVNWTEAPFPEGFISIAQVEQELRAWQIDDVHAQVAEQAMHYYGPGDYATVYDSRIPVGRMVGMYDILQGWIAQMILKHVDDELFEFRVFTDGQFAAVYTVQDIVATKLDGSKLVERIRQTDCLHRVDSHWYSYVESVSWPIDAETGKVALNFTETSETPENAKSLRTPKIA